jgi:type IV pilus assembly protein PilB
LAQLIQWVGDAKAVSQGVSGVISQKLIRKLCQDCREAYRPNEKFIAKLGLPPDTKVLYRKPKRVKDEEGADEEWEPCDTCGDVGYVGRIGIFEVIEMSEGMRQLVATSPSVKAIKDLARKEKMWSFQKDGMRLVAEGVTSVEELQRLFKEG